MNVLNFKILKGIVKTLGDSSISGVTTRYSYIELSDGQIIKQLGSPIGINGHLQAAQASGEPVELHIAESPFDAERPGFVAIKRVDGKLFAGAFPKKLPTQFFTITGPLIFLGFLTIWLYGIGIVFWVLAWKYSSRFRRGKKALQELGNYINSLPSPIIV
jgi:hypothetical protein